MFTDSTQASGSLFEFNECVSAREWVVRLRRRAPTGHGESKERSLCRVISGAESYKLNALYSSEKEKARARHGAFGKASLCIIFSTYLVVTT